MNDDFIKTLTDLACETARFVCIIAMVVMLVAFFAMVGTCAKRINENAAAMSWYMKHDKL